MKQAISADIRRLVMLRADQRCEYCLLHQNDSFLTFTLDHIASLKHGGGNEIENLAFACAHCNQHKGSDLTTFLESYDDIVILFNPRVHRWSEHFEAVGGEIIPKSRIGQATVKLLRLNDHDRLIIRQLLTRAGRYP